MRSSSAPPQRQGPIGGSTPDFSLVAGGPLFQLFLKTRLSQDRLEMLRRRMVLIPALAWIPLLVLTWVDGTALGGGVSVPFLTDVEAYARFLVAIPILLAAEWYVHNRLRPIIENFRSRDIVTDTVGPQFEDAIASAVRWRNSMTAEIALLVLVLVIGPLVWLHGLALQTDTWYAHSGKDGMELSRAGFWFVHVSAPIFQFLLLRWYYRLAIWWRFLWRVSRLPLELKPLHPDRSGGIGFLSASVGSFTPVLVAQSVVVSGLIFSRVMTGAATALDFRSEAALLVVFLMAQVVVPLLFFMPNLIASRRSGIGRFGLLATHYARDFERKWLQGAPPEDEALLDSGDFQSFNDLTGGYEVVREMRMFPFGTPMLLQLAIWTAIPFGPLVLTVIPFSELVQRMVSMLL